MRASGSGAGGWLRVVGPGLFLAAGLVALALAAGCSPPTPAEALRADAQAVARGKALFVGTCAGYCHSPTVERAAPNLFDCVWKNGGGGDRELFDVIADGVPGTPMIAFRGKLPEGDEDIWRLVAYLGSARQSC